MHGLFFFYLISLKGAPQFIIFTVSFLPWKQGWERFFCSPCWKPLVFDWMLCWVSWWLLSFVAGCLTQATCGAVIGSGSQVLFCSYLLCVLCMLLSQVSRILFLSNSVFNNDDIAGSVSVGFICWLFLSLQALVASHSSWIMCEFYYFDYCFIFFDLRYTSFSFIYLSSPYWVIR